MGGGVEDWGKRSQEGGGWGGGVLKTGARGHRKVEEGWWWWRRLGKRALDGGGGDGGGGGGGEAWARGCWMVGWGGRREEGEGGMGMRLDGDQGCVSVTYLFCGCRSGWRRMGRMDFHSCAAARS